MSPTHNPDTDPKPRRTVNLHWKNSFLDREVKLLIDNDDDRTDDEIRWDWLQRCNAHMDPAFPMYRRLVQA